MIRVDDVTHAFGERVVLRSVSVTLTERRIGIIGANGSGKSTFARLLNGLVLPDEGTVSVNGVTTATDAGAVRREVGFVFTDPDAQIVMPTVAEDVAFGLRKHRLGKDKVGRLVADALAGVGLGDHADHPAHLLSGGQKQLLAITSVLITEPRILVCDEPTTLLDLPNTRRVLAMLAALPQQVIMVTHDLDSVAGYDRVLLFHEGRLAADDAPAPAVAYYRSLVEE